MKRDLSRSWLLLLAVSAFGLILAQLLYKSRVEIYLDTPAVDFFQVFYPVEDTYVASSTDRHLYPAGKDIRVLFIHSRGSIEQLRLDPFDGPSTAVLKKITISNFFFSRSVSGEALLERLKVVQMLEIPRIEGGGILLKGTSFDPILVVDLKNIESSFNDRHVVTWALLSILGFLVCLQAFSGIQTPRRTSSRLLLVAIGSALAFTLVFYPGFMTYDSLHALRASRYGVTEAVWPPMVSYIWRLVAVASEDPAAMYFAQLLLFFFCLMAVVYALTQRFRLAVWSLVLVCAMPVLLGTLAAIWKDVLMAGLLLAAMLLSFRVTLARSVGQAIVYFSLAAVLMLVAASSRHNAITAVLPMAFYASWALLKKANLAQGAKGLAIAGLVGTVTLVSVYAGKLFFDKYSLPELQAIDSTGNFMPVVRGMDLFAASLCLQENLLQEHSPRLTLEDISKDFDPRHSNYSLEAFKKVDGLGSPEFNRIWWKTLREHPICLLSNKFLLAKHTLGATLQGQFLLISPQVDLNEFGYFLPESSFRTAVIKSAVGVSDWLFVRPWIFFVLSFPAMVFLAVKSSLRLEYFVIFSSSMLYALGFFMFGNAADARLLFYSNALNLMLVCAAAVVYFSRSSERRAEAARAWEAVK
ncbi:hypothetical protein [Pseudorhodoferax sp.]|uniref:hypothetical protein n=1 Tax=Pseudorhodoferax sp. TaxID=1993553 RepID=UPI002DD69B06|nr:hypothetical protein [Pseudorhodoferax sp.]